MSSAPLKVQIAAIEKSAKEEVRISLTEYRGSRFFDARIYVEYTGPAGVFGPTKSGFSLPFAKLPELVRAVQEAEAQARSLGLIGGDQ